MAQHLTEKLNLPKVTVVLMPPLTRNVLMGVHTNAPLTTKEK